MGARGFPHRGHGHGAKEEMCVEREKTPILYKRVLLYSHFRSRPVWGRGCPRQRLRPPESCRPPGPRSCQLARCPRTLPPPLRRPLCPSLARRFRADPHEVGRIEGLGPESYEVGTGVDQGQRRPRAGHYRRLWERLWERRLELGANTYRVLVPPKSTLSRIRGDLDVRVPRRSARARASVRRWPWSSRRGRSVQVKLIKMGGRLVRHSPSIDLSVVRGVGSSTVVRGSVGSYRPVIAGAKLREGITLYSSCTWRRRARSRC